MLKALFFWLDQHPWFYWTTLACSVLLLVGWVLAGQRVSNARGRFLTALVLLTVLLGCRWPFLFSATEYNIDESQFIAWAITLTHDPVFWRSVDGTTSGPLNIAALLPLHWLGLPLDYFTARLTGLLLVWAGLLGTYGALRLYYGRGPARLGLLPAVIFLSLVTQSDFVHYSSEHVPLALCGLAIYLLALGHRAGRHRLPLGFAGGFAAGMLPWAKLQAGPLGAALVCWSCWSCQAGRNEQSPDTRRRMAAVLLGAAAPSLLAVAVIGWTGQGATFFQDYILQNIHYAGSANTLGQTLALLWHYATDTYLLPCFLLAHCTALGLGGIWSLWQKKLPDLPWWGGALFTLVGAASVLLPRRGYLHYALLLVIPLTLWGGAAVGNLFARLQGVGLRRMLLVVLIVLGALGPLSLRLTQPKPEILGQLNEHWRHPRSALGNVLRAGTRPGDTLALWGWDSRLFVEAGLPQATKESYSYWSLIPSPSQDYHRLAYLRQLTLNQPVFFVDAVGPQSHYFEFRATAGHETFPALRDYISGHYTLVADFGSARLYVRNDQTSREALTLPAFQKAVTAGRRESGPGNLSELLLDLPGLSGRTIDGQPVLMVLPPAQAEFALNGTELEFIFQYGYDPRAYQDESQGNGTVLTVTLHEPDRPPVELFRRLLDPAHVAADRGPHTAQIILPSYVAGSRLVLQSDPGAYRDTAWDWAYITRMRFRRDPYYVDYLLTGRGTKIHP